MARSRRVQPGSLLSLLVPGAVLLGACGNASPHARALPPLAEALVESPQVARPAAVDEPSARAPEPLEPPSNAPFLEHPEALHRFFAALSELEQSQRSDDVRVLQFGDSHTAADYQTGPLRRALQHRFGDGGRGFVSVGRPWKFYTQEGIHANGMTGWSPERGHYARGEFNGDGEYGLVGVSIRAREQGARAYTDFAAPSSRLELAYLEAPRAGSFDVFVDAQRIQRVRTDGPTLKAAHVAIDVENGPHRVELVARGDGDVRVFGLTLDSPKLGVTLDALGVNGARVCDLLRTNEDHFQDELRHRDPSLVVLAYGTNESGDDTPLATYERQMVLVLGRIARAVPTASCLILGPPDRAEKRRLVVPAGQASAASSVQTVWTTMPRLREIADLVRRVATAAGCAYYSQLDAMGGAGSIAGWALESPPRAMLDRVHLSRQGYAELGDALAHDLIAAYDSYRAAGALKPTLPLPLPARPPAGSADVAFDGR